MTTNATMEGVVLKSPDDLNKKAIKLARRVQSLLAQRDAISIEIVKTTRNDWVLRVDGGRPERIY